MKYTRRVMAIARRSIHTAEFKEGVYGEAVSALYPDEFDDVCAITRGHVSCDYYGMGMMAAGSGTVGFLWNYWHDLPYTGDMRVALLGMDGKPLSAYTLDDSDRIETNSVRATVTWRGRGNLSALVGREVQLQFAGRRAKLYSFRFEPSR